MGERFAWFTDNLEQFGEQECLTPEQFAQLIEQYVYNASMYTNDV